MSKVDKEVRARIDQLSDEQLDRKVKGLRETIATLNVELDYAARSLRDRRAAAFKAAQKRAREQA